MPSGVKPKHGSPAVLPARSKRKANTPVVGDGRDADNASVSGLSEEGRYLFQMMLDKLDKLNDSLLSRDEKIDELHRENVNLRKALSRLERKGGQC